MRSDKLAERFSPAANGVGFLRLVFAGGVLLSHALPLGFGQADLGLYLTRGQTSVAALAVDGFFVLSGFLITASALKLTVPRYLWHRFLRIFPGLWVSLLVAAFVAAPAAALIERGTLAGFWTNPQGPLPYLAANWAGGIRQWTISGLLSTTPYGRVNPWGGSAFNGSLWSLVYEILCYAAVAMLAFTLVLRRARRAVLLLTAAVFAVIIAGPAGGTIGPLPLLGPLSTQNLVSLGFLFLLGMVAKLYADRLPVSPVLAGAAAALLLGSMALGGFTVLGVPAFAYLVLFAACTLPNWSHGIGRRRDYSYGIYIYAFPVQQLLALVGVPRLGFLAYVALSAAATTVLAGASWHLVERPAMSLRDVRLPRRSGQPVPVPGV
jgi:peptidoglycan/LPS O-acetylase OafA/YrhL